MEPGASRTAELTIERVVPAGDGLARLEGHVVFVPGALPGDRVRATVSRGGTGFLRAADVRLVAAGRARRPDDEICPRAADGSCGGCDWPAARLDAHEGLKGQLVADALRRIGGFREGDLPEFRFREAPRKYRLRSRLHLDALGRLGFYAPLSHDVSDLTACEIVSDALLARLASARAALSGFPGMTGSLQTLETPDGHEVLAELRVERGVADPAPLAAALRSAFDGVRVIGADGTRAAAGPTALTIPAGGARFQVSVASFFQGNRFLLDGFLEEARAAIGVALSGGPVWRALDLYAGAGFLTRPLLEARIPTTAVEMDPSASADLAVNLAAWVEEGLPKGKAFGTSAESFLTSSRERVDFVLADPPRDGMSREVRAGILRLAPRAILLVSCDPATLARDLAAFRERYEVERVVLLDLFPQTHHVETLVLLRARRGR